MGSLFVTAIRATAVTLVVTGLLYPLAMTGLAQVLFPYRSNGSLVSDEKGQVVGSELIGQPFTRSEYLWPRPSAAGANGYDAAASSGSNLGPTSQKLRDRITAEIARLTEANPDASGPIPSDLVTASASGLDPHISRAAANYQVARVARARSLPESRVRELVDRHTERPLLGFLGESRVHVLRLNLDLTDSSATGR